MEDRFGRVVPDSQAPAIHMAAARGARAMNLAWLDSVVIS